MQQSLLTFSMNFFVTVEFYVILAVVAAAIVALAAQPGSLAPVREILLGCRLEDCGEDIEPTVKMECLGNGQIVVTRTAVANICPDGAVSLAIKVKGSDISVEERIVPGKGLLGHSVTATATLPFIKLQRFHVSYNSSSTGLFAAFTFPARPGMEVVRPLHT